MADLKSIIELYKEKKYIETKISKVLKPLETRLEEVKNLLEEALHENSMQFKSLIVKKVIEGFNEQQKRDYEKEHSLRQKELKDMAEGSCFYSRNRGMFDPEYDDFETIDIEMDGKNFRLLIADISKRETISGILTIYPSVYWTAWINPKELNSNLN